MVGQQQLGTATRTWPIPVTGRLEEATATRLEPLMEAELEQATEMVKGSALEQATGMVKGAASQLELLRAPATLLSPGSSATLLPPGASATLLPPGASATLLPPRASATLWHSDHRRHSVSGLSEPIPGLVVLNLMAAQPLTDHLHQGQVVLQVAVNHWDLLHPQP